MNARRKGIGESRENVESSVPLSVRNLAQPANSGKVRSPIVRPAQPCTPKPCEDSLCDIYNSIRNSGVINWTFNPDVGDESFLTFGNEDVPGTAYAPANGVEIAYFVVSEGYRGLLELVGLQVTPASAYQNISWQLRISGQAIPKWITSPIPGNHIDHPIPFKAAVPVGKRLSLFAINTGVGQVSCQASLSGFMRPVSDKKVGA